MSETDILDLVLQSCLYLYQCWPKLVVKFASGGLKLTTGSKLLVVVRFSPAKEIGIQLEKSCFFKMKLQT